MSETIFSELPRGAYDVLRLALERAGLPIDDLDAPGRTFFSLSDPHGPIGYIRLEGSGADRLLRSLVVLPSRRGAGHGQAIVRALEAVAAGDVARLHLLTTDAAPFFRALGYADADRARAPDPISATAQFTSLCPASATYLVKELG